MNMHYLCHSDLYNTVQRQLGVARPNTLLKQACFVKNKMDTYIAKGDHSYLRKSALSCHVSGNNFCDCVFAFLDREAFF